MDMMGGRRTCWIQHDNIIGYGDHYIQSTQVQAHKVDEFIAIDQLAQCIKMLKRLGSKLHQPPDQ